LFLFAQIVKSTSILNFSVSKHFFPPILVFQNTKIIHFQVTLGESCKKITTFAQSGLFFRKKFVSLPPK